MIRSGLVIPFICLVLTTTAGATETVKQRDQREAVQKQLQTMLYDVNQKFDRLKGRAVKENSTQEFNRALEELSKKQGAAGKKLRDLQAASPENWDRLKAETVSAIDDINSMYSKISSLLK